LPLTGVSVGSCGHVLVLFGTEAQGPSNFSALETPALATLIVEEQGLHAVTPKETAPSQIGFRGSPWTSTSRPA